ncbi:primosomal protein DnaI [Paenibacillus sp. IB182496]|uniref:Primosomal protein DnaI n=1 Tax=Paenibacillus sabuli TaxID=2772509 RepID=A0A927GS66_9BACL|nr:primosomal protein DnaI [Paenibacillus sabuli]MBD2845715.1 primosomal protein DnaI [Paenibacillus sabuli]
MESLGDVLKQWSGGQRMQARADQLREELMDDPLIVKLRSSYTELSDAVLRRNLNLLYQYRNEHRSCTHCPGLDRCPNALEGHYTMLAAEERGAGGEVGLVDRKVPCRKLLARRHEQQLRSRVRSFYMDEAAQAGGYSADEILEKDLERAKAVGKLMQYIDLTRREGLQRRGLYLAGKFGTGKTYLMGYMLSELAKAGYSGVIVYMPEFVEDLKSMFQEPHRIRETIELMKETDLLVFDDIGAENLNPWVRDHVLGTILNYRMNRKPTFYTSNQDLDVLERHFSFTSKDGDELHKGQRLMDRVRPFVDYVLVGGTNKRGAD